MTKTKAKEPSSPPVSPEAAPLSEEGGSGAPAPEKGDAVQGEKPVTAKPDPVKPDPTRYGDWEKNGRCIDF